MSHPYALVLTANAATKVLNEHIIRPLTSLFHNKEDTKPTWLIPDAACEIIWNAITPEEIEEIKSKVLQSLKGLPIDVNVVSATPKTRRKKLLVADMESTIIEQELVDELAALADKKEEISALTLKTMNGEIDFTQSLRRRVKLLRGLNTQAFEIVLHRTTDMPGAKILITQMKEKGAKCALISGGFIYFTEKISQHFGFDEYCGNIWQVHDSQLTGEVLDPVIDSEAKKMHLFRLANTYQLQLEETLAVGDGANDLLMLQAAGLGVAYHAKPLVREAMRKCKTGAIVDHADLTALLALQGYGL